MGVVQNKGRKEGRKRKVTEGNGSGTTKEGRREGGGR